MALRNNFPKDASGWRMAINISTKRPTRTPHKPQDQNRELLNVNGKESRVNETAPRERERKAFKHRAGEVARERSERD